MKRNHNFSNPIFEGHYTKCFGSRDSFLSFLWTSHKKSTTLGQDLAKGVLLHLIEVDKNEAFVVHKEKKACLQREESWLLQNIFSV